MPVRAIAELKEFRLSNDYTYDELSEVMADHGVPVSSRTLHYMLRNLDHTPRERTIYKVKRFLSLMATAARRRRRRTSSERTALAARA